MKLRNLLVIVLLANILVVCQSRPGAAATTDTEWKVLSEGVIEVRFPKGLDAVAGEVLDRAGFFLLDTSLFLGIPVRGPYRIVIAGSTEEFIALQPTSLPAPEWAGALTYPSLKTVLIKSPGTMKVSGSAYWALLQHEMVHLIMGGEEILSDIYFPKWFAEGVATYLSGEMYLSRLLNLGWAQLRGQSSTFRELSDNFPKDPARAEAAYARSYLFIKYMTNRFGEDSISRLVKRSLQDGGLEKGFYDEFGVTLAEELKGFDQYARVKATWIPTITSTATVWALITALFLFTYVRKKTKNAQMLARWDEEEWERSVDERSTEDENREEKPTLH